MPATAALRQLVDPFDPVEAIPASAHYLEDLVARFGNLGVVLLWPTASPKGARVRRPSTRGQKELRNWHRKCGREAIEDSADDRASHVDRATLENCARQLATGGVSLADVFKVNVYLSDLTEWARFNAVYEEILPTPLPVRTAVQAVLMPGYRVEIEMWAVKGDQ